MDSAYQSALGNWDQTHSQIGGGVILHSHADFKIEIDERRAAYPSWLFRFDTACLHDSGWHGTSTNVLVHGASGEVLGWGGVSH